jgi:uncharacterized protein (TIGR02147 family)
MVEECRAMQSIFEYTDFRQYLKAVFAERKGTDPKFSHRWLAERLGLATPNFILLVMQGKRNLNRGLCLRLSQVLGHNAKEAAYFEEAVNFCQAKADSVKALSFERMRTLRRGTAIAAIAEDQYEYYATWYHPVVRELVTIPALGSDPAALAKALTPSITPKQAKQSVALLVRLGMLRKQGGRYVQTSTLIATAPEVNSLAVRNFHRVMGRMAVEALDRVDKEERNITAYTLKLSRKGYESAKQKLEELGKELLASADAETEADRVYQVNLQLFPVSRSANKE